MIREYKVMSIFTKKNKKNKQTRCAFIRKIIIRISSLYIISVVYPHVITTKIAFKLLSWSCPRERLVARQHFVNNRIFPYSFNPLF